MSAAQSMPYGSWPSPITAAMVATSGVSLSHLVVENGALYWVEGRPRERGRQVVVCRTPDGAISDVTPPGYNVRTRVHEYGGGAYCVHGATLYFSNWDDQRLYRQDLAGGPPRPITPEPELPAGTRYADGRVTPDGRLLVCVRETHAEGREATNDLVVIPTDGAWPPRTIAAGYDFYSSPRPSPDGRRLAWTCWNHPHMPWDESELWVADLATDGTLSGEHRVAGGAQVSVIMPAWSPTGTLYAVSDHTNWWNLYSVSGDGIKAAAPMEAEVGEPPWTFGGSRYAFLEGGRIACAYGSAGTVRLGVIAPGRESVEVEPIETPYTALSSLQSDGRTLWFIGAGPLSPSAIAALDLETGALQVIRPSRAEALDERFLSVPSTIAFPTEGGVTAHAFYYAPVNPCCGGPAGERPPLLVCSHGGPTGATTGTLRLNVQYWTSRGFAVVDVNYGGSTGYGRAYRQRLNGQWGVVDVADCIAAARYLVDRGLADERRLAIRGGSAGGYTTLCAVVFSSAFAAGASHYGIADLETFITSTHKFESRYIDSLIGPYPAARDAYRARSAIHFTERLSCPLILFQGLEDRIVPPSQAEQMIGVLRARGLPFAYLAFEGEQHGFRRAETIQRVHEAELSFYGRVFGFTPADAITPVTIENFT